MQLFPKSLCVLALFLSGLSIAEEKKPSPSPTAPGSLVQSALSPELTKMFPIGREFKGVAIPSYDDTRLKSVMNAETIIRVDEQFLDLTDLVIQVYDSTGKPETTISMDRAAYDLTTGVLTSKTPSEIKQPRFTMTGDQMTFDSNTQVSVLEGNVRVVVPDAGKMMPAFGMPGMGGK